MLGSNGTTVLQDFGFLRCFQ